MLRLVTAVALATAVTIASASSWASASPSAPASSSPAFTAPAGTRASCATDADCCYAGSCDAATGTCECDPGFGGGSCCTFQFAPAPRNLISKLPESSGFAEDYAWGGSVIGEL